MISVFELFKIGIGPSSSHTVGPMKAAAAFVEALEGRGVFPQTDSVVVDLYGSLAFTGKGHAVDKALVLGLSGEKPATIDPDAADRIVANTRATKSLRLAGRRAIDFDPDTAIRFDRLAEPKRHPNTLRLRAFDAAGATLLDETWCSIGGGFILREDEAEAQGAANVSYPHPFRSAADLIARGRESGLDIAAMMRANEAVLRPPAEVAAHIDLVIAAMLSCIERGLAVDGELPGGLKVKRRAKAIYERLKANATLNARAAHEIMDYVSVYAMAVNEENAAGGRVVTAPTNGAAGVIPSVLRYYRDHCIGANEEGMRVFILTATAIGALFKMNASISGAEVGCQGEVGVACSMAAAGLCAALGGTNAQIENAAEIGMEHHLGMTCDPVGGLVQIPCIERNAFGAVKAIAAASLALHGDGSHKVSLDQVIATMRQTGADMQSKYKETSLGGLAVNFVEC
jgi:L-serine dehydratase